MERNLANREMWRAKFNAAMDKIDKRAKGTKNNLTFQSRYWVFVSGPALIHNGRKP